MARGEGGDCQLGRYEEIVLCVQHAQSAAQTFSSLFKSAIVQRAHTIAELGEIEQRWIDQRGIISDWIIQEKKGVGVIFERSLLI